MRSNAEVGEIKRISILLLLSLAVACSRSTPEDVAVKPGRAFYHWQGRFAISEDQQQTLAKLGVRRIYLRLFDLDWDPHVQKVDVLGALQVETDAVTAVPPEREIVPVVFLRHRIFGHLDAAGTTQLAGQVWERVLRYRKTLGRAISEVQLDCDWTDSTREGFFAFVGQLRALAAPQSIALSATIRLHQIKYRERTGIPPVDRGMLMFYNMGPIDADPTTEAIFSANETGRYLSRLSSYPLPLDLALPIWSWVIHTRDAQVVGLLQGSDPAVLSQQPFLRRRQEQQFEVTEATFFDGVFLRKGDRLNVEEMTTAKAEAVARLVTGHVAPDPRRTVALFDLSERNVKRHGVSGLEAIFAQTN